MTKYRLAFQKDFFFKKEFTYILKLSIFVEKFY
jgi:hypothetical protein